MALTTGRAPTGLLSLDLEADDRLRHHLVHAHRRAGHELNQMMLAGIHRLEHVDGELGLLSLDHDHVI